MSPRWRFELVSGRRRRSADGRIHWQSSAYRSSTHLPGSAAVTAADLSVAAMLTSLPQDFPAAVCRVAALGFRHVDVVAVADRSLADLEALAETGVVVRCAAVGRGLPADQALDAVERGQRQAALDVLKLHVSDAARLGATHCYVVPGTDASADGLARFADSCALLADFAAQRMVRLCVEHTPGRALPSAAATLTWLEQLGHPNLALLLDVGHCLISHERPAAAVVQAGRRLGYVQLDDNDGVHDLHLPLLAGQLTEELLAEVLGTLRLHSYGGALALELNAQNPEPEKGLAEGKALLERLLGTAA
jgi:sugar phosphate isomerase/epimerase